MTTFQIFQLTTQCGAVIQTAKLTAQESFELVRVTQCPVVCELCHHQHGNELVRKIERVLFLP